MQPKLDQWIAGYIDFFTDKIHQKILLLCAHRPGFQPQVKRLSKVRGKDERVSKNFKKKG